jgi:hypothetical protein
LGTQSWLSKQHSSQAAGCGERRALQDAESARRKASGRKELTAVDGQRSGGCRPLQELASPVHRILQRAESSGMDFRKSTCGCFVLPVGQLISTHPALNALVPRDCHGITDSRAPWWGALITSGTPSLHAARTMDSHVAPSTSPKKSNDRSPKAIRTTTDTLFTTFGSQCVAASDSAFPTDSLSGHRT